MSGQTGTLGKYQIIREIARSNDIVYEAYDPVMNRRVALKELAMPSGSTGPQQEDRRNRFLREARAAGTLTHPNIVTIYEYGEESGRHFIAMEFLDGHTLRNEIDTHGFLAADRAVEIASFVLDALEYAHNHGVIHRDIKPDNIQLLPDGRVKITDFGIARLTFEPNLTMDGQVFGTPSYMSPEQVVGKEIDARSDLFSVGVVLYEMLSGKKPYGGDSVVSITYSIMHTEPDQPSQVNWAIWQVLERSLEKSTQLRHSGAPEMKRALQDAMKASSSVVMDPAPQQNSNYPTFGFPPQQQNSPAPPPNNPYVQPQGQANMAQPSGGQIQPYGSSNPGVYAYNPYQSGAANQGVYGGPVPGQPYVPPPIYYPPGPRAPMMKPETRQFLRKLGLTFLILGTFFGLVIAIVGGLSTAFQRAERQQRDRAVMAQLSEIKTQDPAQAIRSWEAKIPSLQDAANIASAKEQLAVLYERRGKQLLANADMTGAEAAYQKASELDPKNGAYMSDLGDLYARAAQRESDQNQSASYWQASADHWERAYRSALVPEKRAAYRTGAVTALQNLGKVKGMYGDTSGARDAYYRAMDLCEPSSADYERTLQLLNQLVR